MSIFRGLFSCGACAPHQHPAQPPICTGVAADLPSFQNHRHPETATANAIPGAIAVETSPQQHQRPEPTAEPVPARRASLILKRHSLLPTYHQKGQPWLFKVRMLCAHKEAFTCMCSLCNCFRAHYNTVQVATLSRELLLAPNMIYQECLCEQLAA